MSNVKRDDDQHTDCDADSPLDGKEFRSYVAEVGKLILAAEHGMSIADIRRALGSSISRRFNLLDAIGSLEAARVIESRQAGSMQRYVPYNRAIPVLPNKWQFAFIPSDKKWTAGVDSERKVLA